MGPSHGIGGGVGVGKHQDGVDGHLVGPCSGLVGNETGKAGLLLGEVGFGWFEGCAVCCALAPEGVGAVVLLEWVWLGVSLDLGLDLAMGWDRGWSGAGQWSIL